MFQFLPPLIGAGVGALSNKRNPLEGALLGGALGAGGGLLGGAMGLGGAAGAAGAGEAATIGLGAQNTAMAGLGTGSAVPALSVGTAVPSISVPAASSGGLLGGLKSAAGHAKPFMDAAVPAMQAASMFQKEEQPQIQASPVMQPAGPNMTMNNLMNSIYGEQQQQTDKEAQKRAMRRKLIGGNYGGLIG